MTDFETKKKALKGRLRFQIGRLGRVPSWWWRRYPGQADRAAELAGKVYVAVDVNGDLESAEGYLLTLTEELDAINDKLDDLGSDPLP